MQNYSGCIDWNSLGTLAFASHFTISIVDSYSMKLKKALENGKNTITHLKWSKINETERPLIKLAACDDLGTISIWNTCENSVLNELKESSSIYDLRWHLITTNNKEVLAVLYESNKFIIWDANLGIKLIKKTMPEMVLHFAIDYRDDKLITSSETGSLEVYLNLFDPKQVNPSDKKILHETSIPNATGGQSKFLQLEFHSIQKNELIALFPREICIFDLNNLKKIWHLKLDKSMSSFIQFYSCSIKDILYTLHENGCLSVFERKENEQKKLFFENNQQIRFDEWQFSFNYQMCFQSDPIKLSFKSSKVMGFSVMPSTQKYIAVFLSDNRLLKYEILRKNVIKNKSSFRDDSQIENFLSEVFKEETQKVKLVLDSCSFFYTFNITNVAKVYSPFKESETSQPVLAIGSSSGLIIFDSKDKCIDKKISVLNNSLINGIEWISSNSLIFWSSRSQINDLTAYSTSNEMNQQLAKNEIIVIDIRTSEFTRIREIVGDESPMVSIKLSNLKQFLVILFKDQPFEIWDIKSFTLIKKVSKKSPSIRLLEWFSFETNSLNKQKSQQQELTLTENFICVDVHGLMYSFSIENGVIKDSGKFLPDDGILNNLTSLAIKKDFVIFGDLEGSINKWSIKTKSLNLILSKLGCIKQLKFSPQAESQLLLISCIDTITIFDVNKSLIVSSLNKSRLKAEIIYSDWLTDDSIIIKFSNNLIKTYNLELRQLIDKDINVYLISSAINGLKDDVDSFSMLLLLKRFFYKVLFSLCESEFKDIDELKNAIFLADKNKIISNYLQFTINPDLLSLIFDGLKKFNDCDPIIKKVNMFAYLTLYMSLSSFEVYFWCLMAYVLNENHDKKLFLDYMQSTSYFLNKNHYNFNQLETLKINADSEKNLVYELILCDKKESAFNVLIDANNKNDKNSDYFVNSFKACFIASLKNQSLNSEAKTQIKLVATNLIANGKTSEGVEILCLIDLVTDACRYLQDNNEWEKAAILAKLRLKDTEYITTIKRWCEHLINNNKMEIAILLFISCKQFSDAEKLLSKTNYKEMSFYFIEFMKNV